MPIQNFLRQLGFAGPRAAAKTLDPEPETLPEVETYYLDVYNSYPEILEWLVMLEDDFNYHFTYYYPLLCYADICNPRIAEVTIMKQGAVAFVPAVMPAYKAGDSQLEEVVMMLFEREDVRQILFEDAEISRTYHKGFREEESIYQTEIVALYDE